MFKTDIDEIFVVIPAKDEERFIEHVINKTLEAGFHNIVVVNDNSSDKTKEIVHNHDHEVVVLDHIINLGAGAATKTGIDYALSRGAKYIATIDADYQHNPNDLIPLIECIEKKNVDLVIGSRFLKKNAIPVSRILFNFVGNIINFFITGLVITDSQSGMKVMSKRFAENLTITYNGYEFCIEIIKNAKINKNSVYEYPIDVRYSKETMEKGQNIYTGFGMVGKLLNPFKNR
ncbi:MAG: glycosyltransferase family 2 protein [Saprospiraceae bacterium]|nr:glycosyltransferase family 2 protein [Saprospiraceae bacterium]